MGPDISDRTITIDLPRRIAGADGKTTYDQLTVVAPRVLWRRQAEAQLRNGTHPEALTKYATELVARCCDVPAFVIEQLDVCEFDVAWSHVSGFFTSGPRTGTI